MTKILIKKERGKIKIMKTNKKLLASALALGLAAVSTVGSTYAWFSMNTQVTATGMNVKAKAEGGIVISNQNTSASKWTASATAANAALTELIPTSTLNPR